MPPGTVRFRFPFRAHKSVVADGVMRTEGAGRHAENIANGWWDPVAEGDASSDSVCLAYPTPRLSW